MFKNDIKIYDNEIQIVQQTCNCSYSEAIQMLMLMEQRERNTQLRNIDENLSLIKQSLNDIYLSI